MADFTPGPWLVGRITETGLPAVIGENGPVIAELTAYAQPNDVRLIAAAPALYEALRRLSGEASDYRTGFSGADAIDAAIRDADALLLALGEKP